MPSAEERLRAAGFPARKLLEDFDSEYPHSFDRETVARLGKLDFVAARRNVVFVGPPGTGKTHLAVGLGVRACQAGHSVLFATAEEWAARLAGARDAGRLAEELAALDDHPVLIVDEVGYTPSSGDRRPLLPADRAPLRTFLADRDQRPSARPLGRDLRRPLRPRHGGPAGPPRRVSCGSTGRVIGCGALLQRGQSDVVDQRSFDGEPLGDQRFGAGDGERQRQRGRVRGGRGGERADRRDGGEQGADGGGDRGTGGVLGTHDDFGAFLKPTEERAGPRELGPARERGRDSSEGQAPAEIDADGGGLGGGGADHRCGGGQDGGDTANGSHGDSLFGCLLRTTGWLPGASRRDAGGPSRSIQEWESPAWRA